jgi:fatty acid desaturase
MNTLNNLYNIKNQYEKFSKEMTHSTYLKTLKQNNRAYRHVLRFFLNIAMFVFLIVTLKLSWAYAFILGVVLYPAYLFFQGLILSGFMIHSHELSHNHIKYKPMNDFIGIISGFFCAMNFYSFQYAHRFHHKNIGNIDEPEIGAPISLKGQKKIRDSDKLHLFGLRIYTFSKLAWFLLSWPLFIYYGDYCSWILPFRKNTKINLKSLIVFMMFMFINVGALVFFPMSYLFLYFIPMLIGGNRILIITSMHHADKNTIFFSEKEHNRFNLIMSSTDRHFGPIVNFFMMNNGYHIPHHMNPQIAYYDLKKASHFLQEALPQHLPYHYFPNSRFYYDFMTSFYEKRLDKNYDAYQLKYI